MELIGSIGCVSGGRRCFANDGTGKQEPTPNGAASRTVDKAKSAADPFPQSPIP